MTDELQPDAIWACGLPSWVTRILHFDSVTSTMDIARDLWAEPDAHGSVIIADVQTVGRGRRGATWEAAAGAGLTFSLLLRSTSAAEGLGLYSLAAALAVAEGLTCVGIRPRTKWPNDVLVNDRKIAGILVESSPTIGPERMVVLGIGINVNQTASDLEGVWDGRATSARIEVGSTVDRAALLAAVLTSLDGVIEAGLSPRRSAILDRWRRTDVCLGAELEITTGAEVLRGLGRDVTNAGLLVVETEDSQWLELSSADVRVRAAK